MYISMWNHEGYYDPTAGLALRAIIRQNRQKRTPLVYKPFVNIADHLRGGMEPTIRILPEQIDNGGR